MKVDAGALEGQRLRQNQAPALEMILWLASQVKSVHDIEIAARTPIEARSDPRFAGYFHTLCGELDTQTQARVA